MKDKLGVTAIVCLILSLHYADVNYRSYFWEMFFRFSGIIIYICYLIKKDKPKDN